MIERILYILISPSLALSRTVMQPTRRSFDQFWCTLWKSIIDHWDMIQIRWICLLWKHTFCTEQYAYWILQMEFLLFSTLDCYSSASFYCLRIGCHVNLVRTAVFSGILDARLFYVSAVSPALHWFFPKELVSTELYLSSSHWIGSISKCNISPQRSVPKSCLIGY